MERDRILHNQITANSMQADTLDGTEAFTVEQQGLNKVSLISKILTYINNNAGFLTKTNADTYYTPLADDVIKTVKVSLTSAQILAIDQTPVVLIASPGTGKFLDIISMVAKYNFLTAAYAGGGVINLSCATSGNEASLDITPAASTLSHVVITWGVGSVNDVTTSTALVASALSANTSGSGSVDFYITYRIVTA